ncbi:MAG: hypothetical protein WBX37_02510, partial [Pseudolabrys sp.]
FLCGVSNAAIPVVKGHTGQDDARFTSKAKIEATQTNVRFVPIADMSEILFDHGGTARPKSFAVLSAPAPASRPASRPLARDQHNRQRGGIGRCHQVHRRLGRRRQGKVAPIAVSQRATNEQWRISRRGGSSLFNSGINGLLIICS